MAHRGMKKLREVEKIGLVGLCVLMLGTLGIGTGTTLRGCGKSDVTGSFRLEGDQIEVGRADYLEYRGYTLFQNQVLGFPRFGIRFPPPWKFVSKAKMFDPNFAKYQADAKDLWTFIVLDRAAERAGIETSPDSVRHWIRNHHVFQDREGNFSREAYDRFLAEVQGTWATASEFEKLVGRYLRVEYFLSTYDALAKPTEEDVYNTWKNRNQRHDFDYVVQPVADVRKDIDPQSFTKEELQGFYARSEVQSSFRVPARWKIEAAYIYPMSLSDDAFAALRERATTEGLVTMTEKDAKDYYYANESRLYPLEPVRDRLRREWEAEQQKKKDEAGKTDEGEKKDDAGKTDEGEKKDEAGKTDEDGDGGPADDQPADDQPAGAGDDAAPPPEPVYEDPLEKMDKPAIYAKYFKNQVERELFVQRLLTRLLSDERIHERGVEAVAKEWGLTYWKNEKLLDQVGFLSSDPVCGQDLREKIVNMGADQVGGYTKEIVEIGKGLYEPRGWCFFRVLDVVPEHNPELEQPVEEEILRKALWNAAPGLRWTDLDGKPSAEMMRLAFPDADVPAEESYTTEQVLRLMLRQARAIDGAVERLIALRDQVMSSGQDFAAAAAEKGLTIHHVRGVTEETVIPAAIKPAEGGTLTAEEKVVNEDLSRRRFLVKGGMPAQRPNLERIRQTGAEQFLPDALKDKQTDSAYLVYVVSHRIPGPEEMSRVDAERLASELENSNSRPTLRTYFSFENIVERYHLEVKGLTDEEEEGGGAPN